MVIPQRIHFVGIGGIGMSALARYLLARGHDVSGSDQSANGQVPDLRAAGARIAVGHRAVNVRNAELVVVTSAAPESNPEIVAARELGIPVIKRAELLAEISNAGFGIAVAGTHGKTTTSALIGWILVSAAFDPTVLIGGTSANLGSNARVGGDRVVVEADEYDASFLRLRPRIGVITNVEPDHLDFYGSVDRIHDAFRRFAAGVSETLVYCADDPILATIAGGLSVETIGYGRNAGTFRASRIEEDGLMTSFSLIAPEGETRFATPLAGPHHVLNVSAAIVVARVLGVPGPAITEAVASYRGVARRLEVKGEEGGVLVMDDYAHHPTEIKADLAAIKKRYGRPLRVIFQPHTYSRTSDFLADFAQSFSAADAVYLLDIYAARETDTRGMSGEDLARETSLRHPAVTYTPAMGECLVQIARDTRPGDMVVTMGAGDVDRLGPAILDTMRAQDSSPA
ncbi:MAG TPA: UDP-N-acetylmuramate--L-alanine ligase [Chloroflexota bacterium]|nr:UDP-N-acetylmuramate--L-alanine ligase [Chloroflexota bacterium]